MGRFLMYATIALLAVFVLSTFTFLQHGSEGISQVKTYNAGNFPLNQAYDGATVTVDGTVVYNEQADRYEITDDDAAAPTPLTGLKNSDFAPFEGESVRINGKYLVSGGSRIEVHDIRLYEETPGARD